MDLFLSYLLQFLAVLLASFVFLILHNRKKSSTDDVTLPPGRTGWLAGVTEAWQFYRLGKYGRPEKFMFDRMSKHSRDVFTTSLFGTNIAVLCGVSGNKYLCSTTGSKFFNPWSPSCLLKIVPEAAHSFMTRSDLPTAVKSLVYDFLKPEYLREYIPVMDSMIKQHLKSNWLPNKVVKAVSLSNKLTFAIALRLFISVDDPEVLTRLEQPFHLIEEGFISIPINLPGTPFNRALKGSKILRRELIPIIKQRKKQTTARIDALDRMLKATDENGRNMSEEEIAGKILVMLLASYDSTSAAIISIVKYLAENPHVYEKVVEEQVEIANSKPEGKLISLDDIKRMKYSWCVACESLRMIPMGATVFSKAETDTQYAGFSIPKGMKTVCSPSSTHMNPEYFTDPKKFDPSRFEGKGPAPFTFVPFGGGLRICPGREYARVKILVFMHNFVIKFNVKKMNHQETIYKPFPFPTPEDGLPIRLYPKEDET